MRRRMFFKKKEKKEIDVTTLKGAFENRFGKTDRESFLIVVQAFFNELNKDSLVTIPMSLNTNLESPEYQPRFVQLPDGRVGISIITDDEYMNQFDDSTNMKVTMSHLVQMMCQNEICGGIVINPFSKSHCYLPKESILQILDSKRQ